MVTAPRKAIEKVRDEALRTLIGDFRAYSCKRSLGGGFRDAIFRLVCRENRKRR